ncbi:MAG: RNA methyltransferase [Acetatifactor sp.]|nr:RNA methyltransferase [Acetatifactor sp.]
MITSSSNTKVKQVVRWQNKARERREAGIFLTEGFKLFREAPEESIREAYLSEGALERLETERNLKEKLNRVGYETVSGEVFQKMSDTNAPQGILCVVRRPEYELDQLLNTPTPLLVVLENLQDPGNLGTILRTGEGAGITGVILGRETVDIFSPKTIRATMGSIFRVPFVCVEDLVQTIETIRKRGVQTYAAHLSGRSYYDGFSFQGGTAFLIGNEGKGLSAEITALADGLLRIPMEGRVESLNAAVAAALLIYEAHRQRQAE